MVSSVKFAMAPGQMYLAPMLQRTFPARFIASSEAGRGRRMGQQETMVTGKNRIMIYGPKSDGT
jgi:hypothetical protein